MRTISIVNQKGGVGKTTTAQALAVGLAHKGYKVLCVDLDSQTSLSYALKSNIESGGALAVFHDPKTIKKEIRHKECCDVLPSVEGLITADIAIQDVGKEYRLKEALNIVQGDYDYCIIDTPPAIGIALINALTASNYCIITAQADMLSIQGVTRLSGTIKLVQDYCNPDLTILGVLLTRYNGRIKVSQNCAQAISDIAHNMNASKFATNIRECAIIREAQIVQEDVSTYAPKSNAAIDYNNFVLEVLERIEGD